MSIMQDFEKARKTIGAKKYGAFGSLVGMGLGVIFGAKFANFVQEICKRKE